MTALPAFLIAIALLIVPGAIIVFAGWRAQRTVLYLLAPGLSIALMAASATLAPFVGIRWSVLPLSAVTVVAAAAAFLVGRSAAPSAPPTQRRTDLAGLAALVAAGVVQVWQFARAFGAPDNIAQRFDTIVHLNAIRLALDTGDASPFQIGRTSDISFYPNAWHAFTSLIAECSGVDVPTAVNVANLAIVALLWPASMMALSAVLFRARTAALVATAALTSAFGAFPALFFNWGVLYPNAVGFAMIPAALAGALFVYRCNPGRDRIRNWLLLGTLALGTALGHPNALLAATIFAWLLCTGFAVQDALRERSSSRRWRAVLIFTIGLIVCTAFIALARTGDAHSGWQPWGSAAQAFGEGVLVSPRGFAPTVIVSVLLAAAAIGAARRPHRITFLLPLLAAVGLFVLAAGVAHASRLRSFLTNPWYSDPSRFAALLVIAAIPAAVMGALILFDLARAFVQRRTAHRSARVQGVARASASAVAIAVVFSASVGPNVSTSLGQVREAYTATADALLLSPDERALIERLPAYVEPSDLVIGSPRTGVSLAYALEGIHVTERHVFGSPSDDERYLDLNLRRIDTDPAVCAAVDRVGVDFILDFGARDVIDPSGAAAYSGVIDLTASTHLELVDAQGPDARLFRIVGCGG
ncbi:DUF6541 family protein [Microbacterium sp. MRS-1]|uniref:DUF6541 family protein n=1 Tax=Microbacterium sp. MRS-1 TaxID=1451261 RepID=UPI000449738A|nr:DUF6541 family protein [Microbacterium sp. MRS-1]EXJ51339.1 hypothetical protein AS96_09985 [Microbacterium sp. MRS-1]